MTGQMKIGEMFYDVVANTGKALKDLDKFKGRAEKLGGQMTKIGGKMMKGLTLPLLAIGGAALKFSLDFDKAMSKVGSLMPGQVARVKELSRAVQSMAMETGQATGDLADGMYQLISAFGDSAETVKLLEINAKAAAVGVSTVKDAINLTSAVTKAYGDTSANAVKKVADLGLKTVELGQTTFPELALAIGRVTPLTKELGISQEELFTVFATLTGVTGKAAEVSTQFAGTLAALLTPSVDLTKTLDKLGFETGKAMIAELGFQESLVKIAMAAADADIPLAKLLGSKEALIAVLSLTGPQMEIYKQKLLGIEEAADTMEKGFDDLIDGIGATGFSLDQLKQVGTVAMQELGGAIAAALDPQAVKDLKDALGALIKRWDEIGPEGQKIVIQFLALAAAIGPVVYLLGQVATAVAALGVSLTAGLIVGGILAIVAAFTALRVQAAEAGQGVFETWKQGWRIAWIDIQKSCDGIATAIERYFSAAVRDAVTAARNLYTGVRLWLVEKFEDIKQGIKAKIDTIIGYFRNLWQQVVGSSIVPDMINGVKKWMMRLGSDAMVYPVKFATKEAKQAFLDFAGSVKRIISDLGKSIRVDKALAGLGLTDQWTRMRNEAMQLGMAIRSLLGQGLEPQGPVIQWLTERYHKLNDELEVYRKAQEAIARAPQPPMGAIRTLAQTVIDLSEAMASGTLSGEDMAKAQRAVNYAAEQGVELIQDQTEAVKALQAAEQRRIQFLLQQQQGTGLPRTAASLLEGKDTAGTWVPDGAAQGVQLPPWSGTATAFGMAGGSGWGVIVADMLDDVSEGVATVEGDVRLVFDTMEDEGAAVAASLESALTSAITAGIMEGEFSWDSLVDIIKNTVINVAVNALVSGGSVAGALGGIPIVGPILGIFGLAGGGTLQTSGSVVVGEEGPELLSLPAGAQVTPLGKLGNLTTVIELDGREIARKTLPLQAREMQLRGVMG